MIYLPITRSWMVSRRAQRIYLVCALAQLSLLAVVIGGSGGLAVTAAVDRASYLEAVALVRFLMWPGILGTAVLATGMWYFWYGFYEPAWYKKALWFFMLWFSMLLGPLLYYFVVYRRSPVLARN